MSCTYIFHVYVSGNTYDRSLIVDDEETSILLYDVWEQVRIRAYNTNTITLKNKKSLFNMVTFYFNSSG